MPSSSKLLNRIEIFFLEGGGVVQNLCRVGMVQGIAKQICCFGEERSSLHGRYWRSYKFVNI